MSMQTTKIVSYSTSSPMRVQTKRNQLCTNKTTQIYGTSRENVSSPVRKKKKELLFLLNCIRILKVKPQLTD